MLSHKNKRDVWTKITAIVFVFYILFLIYPLFSLLIKSFFDDTTGAVTFEYFQKFFSKKYYLNTLLNSFKVSVSVTILSIVIATPLAYVMSTMKVRGSSWISILILISSMSPPFIGAYAWIMLLGRNGAITNFLQDFLHINVPDIYGFIGIVLVLTLQLSPLVFIFVTGALKNVDSSLIEAAESMNYRGFRKLMKVVIPLIYPTLLASGLLVFMRALADFGTPMLIGEGYKTVPVLIFTEFISEVGGNDGFAAAISVIVVIVATAVFLFQKYVANRTAVTMSVTSPIQEKKEKGWKNILGHGYVYIFILIALLPHIYVIYSSFLKTSGRIFVKGFSLDSYRAAFTKVGDSIQNTFILGGISIAILVFLAILIAYVTVRRRSTLTNILDVLTMFPYIVPGSILGIALLITFNKQPLVLSGTAAIIIVAFVIRRLTYTLRSSAATLQQISVSTEEAAISLGASTMKTFFKITLPLMLPGVISGAIISWVSIISELSTSIILYTPRTKTMTIAIYTEVIRGNFGVAAALSAILTLITVVSLLLFFKISGKKEITM